MPFWGTNPFHECDANARRGAEADGCDSQQWSAQARRNTVSTLTRSRSSEVRVTICSGSVDAVSSQSRGWGAYLQDGGEWRGRPMDQLQRGGRLKAGAKAVGRRTHPRRSGGSSKRRRPGAAREGPRRRGTARQPGWRCLRRGADSSAASCTGRTTQVSLVWSWMLQVGFQTSSQKNPETSGERPTSLRM